MSTWHRWFNKLPGWTQGYAIRWAWAYLGVTGLLALLGPWIANEKPFYCTLDGQAYFPLFSTVSESTLSAAHPAYAPITWKSTPFQTIWRPLIPYSHTTIDLEAGVYQSPLAHQSTGWRFRHWLGTDALGRDVLAGMIRGCRVSLWIGLGSMLLALLIGIPLGSAAAWWGNQGWRMSFLQCILSLMVLLMMWCLWLAPISLIWKSVTSIGLMLMILLVQQTDADRKRKGFTIPLDHMVMAMISILDGIPGLFLLLILVAIVPYRGWLVIMLIIGFMRWTTIARYMRAEVFKMRETNYIRAARVLNIPSLRILRVQILPYAFRPVMVSFVFGISSAILMESSLSFLGIGLPAEEINWGRLLAQSRGHFEAWWLVVFPGIAIFLTLLSLYGIGNAWQKFLVMKNDE